MVNTNKIRGRIMEQGLTIGSLASIIGISPSTLGRKIKNHADMTLGEVESIRDILKIPPERVVDYFFMEE
ncbi:MAG: helix-turn-helix transcriptional regulator [Ruminococcaceae bacterium]|nr:helix-turn-helix transcriptional regulator [Oscillospiraceae bacterium]